MGTTATQERPVPQAFNTVRRRRAAAAEALCVVLLFLSQALLSHAGGPYCVFSRAFKQYELDPRFPPDDQFHYDTGFVEQLRAGPSPSTVAFTPRTANAATGVTEARGPGQPVKFPAELGDIAERALMAFRDGDLSDTNVIIYMEKLEEYFLFLAGCDPDATFRHAEKLLNDAKTAEKAQNKLLKILGELLQAIEWQLRTPFELEFEALKQLVVAYRLNTFRRQLFNYGFRKVPDLEDVYTNAALSKRSAMCLADQVLALKRTATQSTTRQPRSAEGVEGLSIGLEQLAELVWAACGRILRDAVNEEVFDDAADDV